MITESYHALDPNVPSELWLMAELDTQCHHVLTGNRFHWIWDGPVADDGTIMWEWQGQLIEVHFCWCLLDRVEGTYGRCINPDCVDCYVI